MVQLKERRWEVMEVGEEFGPIELAVTDHMIKSFAYAVDDYDPAYLSDAAGTGRLGHPTLLCRDARDVIRTMYDIASGGGGLHAKHECKLYGCPHLGEQVVLTGRHVEKYLKRDKQYIILESEARRKDGTLLLRQRSTHLRGLKPGVARVEAAAAAPPPVPSIVGVPVVEVGVSSVTVGTQLQPIVKTMTQEQFTVFAGTDWKNIHNDLDVARSNGLPTTLASGLQTVAYISELLTRFCGDGWRSGGRMAVAFVAPAFLADTLYTSAQVKEVAAEEHATRVSLEVWCENQAGKKVTVGTASARILSR